MIALINGLSFLVLGYVITALVFQKLKKEGDAKKLIISYVIIVIVVSLITILSSYIKRIIV